MLQKKKWDLIVIGGGHAGCEAAHAAASMGCCVLLLTMKKEAIGRMSCNPAIGGVGKGHLVKEIDALGGIMGFVADETAIQFRKINTKKEKKQPCFSYKKGSFESFLSFSDCTATYPIDIL